MYECPECEFSSFNEYQYKCHMIDNGHQARCETCNKPFWTWAACHQHMNCLDHWAPPPGFECETCTRKFYSQNAVDQHMKALAHYRNYCKSCDRIFQSQNNLKMHLNSKIHRGSSITCPFCKANFSTASGVSHHLETGSCRNAPNLNRDTIHRMIRERDPHGVISNRQIEWHEEENAEYSVTNRAFNGLYWECYICHKQFNTPKALNQHLNSPAHKQKIYHCPNGRCVKQFTALAALFNHLESESCAFIRFEKVQQRMGDVLSGRKLIAF